MGKEYEWLVFFPRVVYVVPAAGSIISQVTIFMNRSIVVVDPAKLCNSSWVDPAY